MKYENKNKKRDKVVLSALREKNLAKIWGRKWQKIWVHPCQVGEREREKVEKLLKKMFETVKELFFKKPETWCSIDRKTGSINRTK